MHPHYFLDIYKIGQEAFSPIQEIEITDKTADELKQIFEDQEAQNNEWRFKRKEA